MPAQYCTNHKNQETLRICGRCERPFCPDCLVATPVGGRCRECARGPKIARMKIEPWRWPLIVLSTALGGVIGGSVIGVASWFVLFIAWFAGQWIAAAILPISGRKPGAALAIVTVVFLVLGVCGSGAVDGALGSLRDPAEYGPMVSAVKTGLLDRVLSPWDWIGAIIMAVSAYGRLR